MTAPSQEAQRPRTVRIYRSRRVVEALQWTDTDENREQFAAWFERHDALFETRGAEVVLPEQEAGLQALIPVGNWILYEDGDFVSMSDQLFTDLYVYDVHGIRVP